MRPVHLGLDELVERILKRALIQDRVIIGIVGCPGSGKSTLTTALIANLASTGLAAVSVPMDGFHLADVELRRLSALDRKGAIDTIDGHGYMATLRRIREQNDEIVYAPAFERDLEQPLAGAIAVPRDVPVVLTEGNYLLDQTPPWRGVKELVDEVWFVHVADLLRQQRLIRRHVGFGKSPVDAREWVIGVDEINAKRVTAQKGHADLQLSEIDIP